MLIKDSKGNKDVLKLKRISFDQNYSSYSVSLESRIATTAGMSHISILLISDEIIFSLPQELILSYEDFTMAQQIQFFENVSRDLVNKYYQIEEMTKMNIEIYQQIEEGLRDDFNESI